MSFMLEAWNALTPSGNMERHNLLICSNLHTVEHLETWIWLISDLRGGTLLRQKAAWVEASGHTKEQIEKVIS